MLPDLESLFPHVSPLQNPLEFLDSHVWGCARGIQLSLKGRSDLLASHDEGERAAEDDLQLNLRAVLSILECYAHSQVCTFCVPAHAAATQPVSPDELPAGQFCEHAELTRSLQGITDPALARALRRSHQATCKVCRAKEQRARSGAPVWTMEAARLHRTI